MIIEEIYKSFKSNKAAEDTLCRARSIGRGPAERPTSLYVKQFQDG